MMAVHRIIIIRWYNPSESWLQPAIVLQFTLCWRLALFFLVNFSFCCVLIIFGFLSKVSQSLVELLRSEFNVSGHLEVLRQFYLFKAGATLHHLTNHIFQREVEGEAWFSRDFLSAVLNEALNYMHPDAIVATPDSLEKK